MTTVTDLWVKPEVVRITRQELLDLQIARLRDGLRAQQRGINRLKGRIARQQKVELENTQLKRQLKETEKALDILKARIEQLEQE